MAINATVMAHHVGYLGFEPYDFNNQFYNNKLIELPNEIQGWEEKSITSGH